MWHVGEGQGGGSGGRSGHWDVGRGASRTSGRRGRREALSTLNSHRVPAEARPWNAGHRLPASSPQPEARAYAQKESRTSEAPRTLQVPGHLAGVLAFQDCLSVPLSKQSLFSIAPLESRKRASEWNRQKQSWKRCWVGDGRSQALRPETRGFNSQLCW